MRRWKAVTVAFVLGVVAMGPVAVWAGVAGFGKVSSQADRQANAWSTNSFKTSSTAFVTMPRFTQTICAKNEISANVSMVVSDASAEFQVVLDGGGAFQPLAVPFDPGVLVRGFSFTFVANAGTFEGSDMHGVEVQVRSPTGEQVSVVKGDVNLVYEVGSQC